MVWLKPIMMSIVSFGLNCSHSDVPGLRNFVVSLVLKESVVNPETLGVEVGVSGVAAGHDGHAVLVQVVGILHLTFEPNRLVLRKITRQKISSVLSVLFLHVSLLQTKWPINCSKLTLKNFKWGFDF